MERALMGRLAVCVAAVVVAIWLLLPTFLGKEVQGTLQRAEDYAKLEDPPAVETVFPWWVNVLPNRVVNLGLDLQGGLDLTLEVDTNEAILASVQRDIPTLRSLAEREGVNLSDVRRERQRPVLLVAPGEGVGLDKVQSLILAGLPGYAYANTVEQEGAKYLRFEMTPAEQTATGKRAVEQALETIRNRIDDTGVKEPSITLKGDSAISIQLPGQTDMESAVSTVGTTAQLQFMLVDEDLMRSARPALMAGIEAARSALPAEEFAKDRVLSEWLVDHGQLAPGKLLLWTYEKGDAGVKERVSTEEGSPYILKDEVVLSGEDINDASTSSDPTRGEYYVTLDFKERGRAVFAEVTGANVKKRFAIVLDDEVRSAPVINERIDGSARISVGSGNMDQQLKEAGQLALVLRSGALPAPVSVGEVRKVGATLGVQAIEQGLTAAVLGSLLVFAFAAFYYRWSGVLADITLLVNVVLVLGLLSAMGATLTLPGICGIALTVGMAVDCNIIIFERIREELRAGKGVRVALEAGFDRAFVAVFDSNVTTLLAGIVLYSYGTGPLKGFAVTLMIGIVTTLFSGVFVSRTLMQLAAQRSDGTRLSI